MQDLNQIKKSEISAVIICHNEAHNLQRCIKSCQHICDEIIVVDSFSTDQTPAIAKKLEVKLVQKEWLGYGAAKNFGASLSSNNWILSIDADECLDEELQNEIKNLSYSEEKLYAFKRLNYIGRKAVRYGEWNPDIKPRIYNKKNTKWNNKAVHEALISDVDLKEILVAGNLLHYSYSSISDLKKRLDKYAKLGAIDLKAKKDTVTLVDIYLRPIGRFFKSYILKFGFLDGVHGWQIAIQNAKAVKKRYFYLKELLKAET